MGSRLGRSMLSTVWIALRRLSRAPAFALGTVTTLALGLGATVAMFGFISAVFWKPLPYPDGDALIEVSYGTAEQPKLGFARDEYQRLEQLEPNLGLGSLEFFPSSVRHDSGPERISALAMSARLFQTLGVRYALGRGVASDEDKPGAALVAVLSHGYWQRRFGGGPHVLGTQVNIDGRPHTVVGVLAPEFRNVLPADVVLAMDARSNTRLRPVYARLRAGQSASELRASLQERRAEIFGAASAAASRPQVSVEPFRDLYTKNFRVGLTLGGVATGLVLMVVTLNTAMLFLSRSLSRRRELAIRSALGATRAQLMLEVLVEAGVLAVCGGLLAAYLGAWGSGSLVSYLETQAATTGDTLGLMSETGFDWRVAAFSVVAALGVALGVGVYPARAATTGDLHQVIQSGGAPAVTPRRKVSALVALQVGIALLLCASTGLLVRSVQELGRRDTGFDPNELLIARTELPAFDAHGEGNLAATLDETARRFADVRGIRSVTYSLGTPGGEAGSESFKIESSTRPGAAAVSVLTYWVGTGFSRTLKPQLVSGRFLQESDVASSEPVAVIDERMVERYFGGEVAASRLVAAEGEQALRVVGVVRHVPIRGLDPLEEPPQVYRPLTQRGPTPIGANASIDFVLATSRSAAELADATRRVLTQLNPNHAPAGLVSMHEQLARQSMPQRILGGVLGTFGLVALALCAFGIYASTRRSVVERTRDLAVQVALGAAPGRIVRHVLVRTGRSVGSGLVLGSIGLALVGNAMRSVLYGVTPLQPSVALTSIAVVCVAALAAALGPALRAAKVDPMLALRHE